MKNLLSSLFVFLFLLLLSYSSIVNAQYNNQKLDIYLLIGQSNMAGRATISQSEKDSLDDVYLFRNDESIVWEKAANPLNKYSTIRADISKQKLGLGYSFAKKMTDSYPEKSFGLVVNAKGGTSIRTWLPGTTYYNEAVRRTKEAMEFGELKGILWHQGESNATSTAYVASLKKMIEGFRKDFGNESLPVVIGEIYPDPDIPAVQFNEYLADAPNVIPFLSIVSSESTTTTDNTHFDTKSQLLMGERYAEAMIKLLGGEGSSISDNIVAEKIIVNQSYYDLMGRLILNPLEKSVLVRKTIYDDGALSFDKILFCE